MTPEKAPNQGVLRFSGGIPAQHRNTPTGPQHPSATGSATPSLVALAEAFIARNFGPSGDGGTQHPSATEGATEVLRPPRNVETPIATPERRVFVLPPNRPRRAVPLDASACPACGGVAFWISLALVRICERCHPPADPRIVARRETAPLEDGKNLATSTQAPRTPEGAASAIPSATNPAGGAA